MTIGARRRCGGCKVRMRSIFVSRFGAMTLAVTSALPGPTDCSGLRILYSRPIKNYNVSTVMSQKKVIAFDSTMFRDK